MSASEFLRWQAVLEEEVEKEFHREDWIGAMVAFEVYQIPFRIFGKKCDLKLKDFVVKFTAGKPEEEKPLTEEELTKKRDEMDLAMRKAILPLFGLSPTGEKITPETGGKAGKPAVPVCKLPGKPNRKPKTRS